MGSLTNQLKFPEQNKAQDYELMKKDIADEDGAEDS